MVLLLKPKVLQKKTVAELLKLDMKHSDSQLKDSELEIGLPTRQALNDVKNSSSLMHGKLSPTFLIFSTDVILAFSAG